MRKLDSRGHQPNQVKRFWPWTCIDRDQLDERNHNSQGEGSWTAQINGELKFDACSKLESKDSQSSRRASESKSRKTKNDPWREITRRRTY